MEKFFNKEIVDYLRAKNRTKVQDMLFQDGDKYIWRQPDTDKDTDGDISSGVRKALTTSLSFSDDPLIGLYPESSKSTTSTAIATDDSTVVQHLQPNYKESSLSRVKTQMKINKRREELDKMLQKSYARHEEVTRIRALLGPFPDEPFLAALDKILYYLNGVCGGASSQEIVTKDSSENVSSESDIQNDTSMCDIDKASIS